LIESVVLFLIFNLNLKTTIQKISSTSTWDFRENLLCSPKKKRIRKKKEFGYADTGSRECGLKGKQPG